MPKLAFLFPGQGAQTVGMAAQLCATLPAARRLFDEAAAILGYDLLEVCTNGPKEKLDSTVISQPAIYVASLAALESLRAQSPDLEKDCIATAGLSLGEFTALTFAGVFTFAEGLNLVKTRGEAMQKASDATPSGMISVLLLPVDQVDELCVKARTAGLMQIANFLCPGNTVVSGINAACAEINKLTTEAGTKTMTLAVAGAFHTPLMKPADEILADALEKATLQPARLPVWSNVDAQPHTDPAEIRGLLVRQVVEPVQWEKTLRGLLAAGVEKFYEIGPQRVLAGLLKRVDRKRECVNVQI
ncbi:MAG: [acyl-carrier-protein] S-malonyltransferase [Gemmataceae bacterium]|nr:[acyl-carrier-protein] S-malonyltransferase [Gemmataceae bacterium]